MKQNSDGKNKSPVWADNVPAPFKLSHFKLIFQKTLYQSEFFIMLSSHHSVIKGECCLLQIAAREGRAFGNKDRKKTEKRRSKGKDR